MLMRPEEDPLDDRGEALGRILEEEAEKGRVVWASFDGVLQVDPETALKQQERLTRLVDATARREDGGALGSHRRLVVDGAQGGAGLALDHDPGLRERTIAQPRHADATVLR